MFITFKKLSDDDDLIFRVDEDDDTNDLKLQNTFESSLEELGNDSLSEEE